MYRLWGNQLCHPRVGEDPFTHVAMYVNCAWIPVYAGVTDTHKKQVSGLWYLFILLVILLTLSPSLFALPDDNKQPLLIRADAVDLSQNQHIGVYQGRVKIDQGSTHILSAKTTMVGNAQNKLIMATFEGNASKQAHYWTKQAQDKPIFHAYADKIYYCPEQDQITLTGNARVVQEQNQITAPTICYNMKTQRVTTPFHSEQTRIIVQSDKIHSMEPDL